MFTHAILQFILFHLLCNPNVAELFCDGIEFINNGQFNQQPTGVCFNSIQTNNNRSRQISTQLICASNGSDIYLHQYERSNCNENNLESNQSYPALLQSTPNNNISNITIHCCSGVQCEYALIRTQLVSSCNDTTANFTVIPNTIIDTTYIMNSCTKSSADHYSQILSCSASNNLTQAIYNASDPEQCNGTIVGLNTFNDGECAANTRTQIICDTAEPQCTPFTTPNTTIFQPISNISTTNKPIFPSTNITFDADLSCNGVQFEDPDGQIQTYPAGACWINEEFDANITSTEYECSFDGQDMYVYTYSGTDCLGTPILSQSLIGLFDEQNITEYYIECCLDECQYGTRRVFDTDDCNVGVANFTYFDEVPVILGQCMSDSNGTSMEFTTCLDGKGMGYIYYDDNDECLGNGTLIENDLEFRDGFCDNNGTQYEIHCATADIQNVDPLFCGATNLNTTTLTPFELVIPSCSAILNPETNQINITWQHVDFGNISDGYYVIEWAWNNRSNYSLVPHNISNELMVIENHLNMTDLYVYPVWNNSMNEGEKTNCSITILNTTTTTTNITNITFQSDLMCNGIQLFAEDGSTETYHTGVCMRPLPLPTYSMKYECSYDGQDVFLLAYNSTTSCTENLIVNLSMIEQHVVNGPYIDYHIECCLESCQYGIRSIYETTDCTQSRFGANVSVFDERPYIVGECMTITPGNTSYKLDACLSGRNFEWLFYDNNSECNGVAISHQDFNTEFTFGYCDENGAQIEIHCGDTETPVVDPDLCGLDLIPNTTVSPDINHTDVPSEIVLQATTTLGPDLSCNGIQFYNADDGTTQSYVTGICQTINNDLSVKAVCGYNGDDVFLTVYASDSCFAVSAIANISLLEYYRGSYTDYDIECCADPCDYGIRTHFNTTDCAADRNAADVPKVDEGPYLVGHCMGIGNHSYELDACLAGANFEWLVYFQTTDCEGPGNPVAALNERYTFGFCDEDGVQYEIECGESERDVVDPAICEVAQTTLPPNTTQGGTETTTIITTGTTISTTESADIRCNGIEFYNSEDGSSRRYVAGICRAIDNDLSVKAMCGYNGEDVYLFAYLSDSCTPETVAGNFSLIETFMSSGLYTDYEIECCADPCDYGMRTHFNTTDCTQDRYAADVPIFEEGPYIIGDCMPVGIGNYSLELDACITGANFEWLLHDSLECEGDGFEFQDYNIEYTFGYCDENGVQYEIECGQSEIQVVDSAICGQTQSTTFSPDTTTTIKTTETTETTKPTETTTTTETTEVDLPCNGIQFYDDQDQQAVMVAAGVCKTLSNGLSAKPECGYYGDDVYLIVYASDSCTPEIIGNYSLVETYISSGIYTEYEIECCADSCDYGIRTHFNTTDCAQDRHAVNVPIFDEGPYIVGDCMTVFNHSVELDACNTGANFDWLVYFDTKECEGLGMEIQDFNIEYTFGYCDEEGVQYEIECGQTEVQVVDPAVCGDATINTPSPTDRESVEETQDTETTEDAETTEYAQTTEATDSAEFGISGTSEEGDGVDQEFFILFNTLFVFFIYALFY